MVAYLAGLLAVAVLTFAVFGMVKFIESLRSGQ